MKRSLRSWLWRVDLAEEVDEEIGFHIEMRTRELVEKGVDPRIARELVLARIGDASRIKRTCVDLGRKREREMRFSQWFDERRQDVRFALRQLKSTPTFTAVAAITLALGIGANSAMFALADATLIRPLPYPSRSGPGHLDVSVWGETSRSVDVRIRGCVARSDRGSGGRCACAARRARGSGRGIQK